MDREARMAIVHGVTKKSDMIEQLNTYFSTLQRSHFLFKLEHFENERDNFYQTYWADKYKLGRFWASWDIESF